VIKYLNSVRVYFIIRFPPPLSNFVLIVLLSVWMSLTSGELCLPIIYTENATKIYSLHWHF